MFDENLEYKLVGMSTLAAKAGKSKAHVGRADISTRLHTLKFCYNATFRL